MITLEGVRKSYGGAPALGPIDLAIQQGRTTVVLGPSGCGKSTLLRLLVGLASCDSGRILIDGVPVGAGHLRSLRRSIGYVIQEGGLFPHLSVLENLLLAPRSYGEPQEASRARASQLGHLVKLPEQVYARYPEQLSGGQRQRVALMRALMLDPQVLLLDEPLGSLDPMIRADLQRDLKKIFVSVGKTVVLVTHDLHEAAYFADTVILLRGGEIVQSGTMGDLLERPSETFVSEFVRAQRGFLRPGPPAGALEDPRS